MVTVPSIDVDRSRARTQPLGVILAAGAGSRWSAAGGSGHKLLAAHRGHTVVWWAVQHALDAGLTVVVVTGAANLTGVLPDGAILVDNPHWANGQSTSLAIGVAEAISRLASGIIVGLGDQPEVPTEAWATVAATAMTSDRPIVIPTYEGVRGQPVGLGASVFSMLSDEGDEGARSLIRVSPHLVTEVPCAGSPRQLTDIDSPRDLDSWN
jgi:molybdenum cofactor cytidylyltransferase